jgi:hypothetical protein
VQEQVQTFGEMATKVELQVIGMAAAACVIAIAGAVVRMYFRVRDLNRDIQMRPTREEMNGLGFKVTQAEKDIVAVQTTVTDLGDLKAIASELRTGLHDVREVLTIFTASTSAQLRRQGESIAYIAGKIGSATGDPMGSPGT